MERAEKEAKLALAMETLRREKLCQLTTALTLLLTLPLDAEVSVQPTTLSPITLGILRSPPFVELGMCVAMLSFF